MIKFLISYDYCPQYSEESLQCEEIFVGNMGSLYQHIALLENNGCDNIDYYRLENVEI